MDALLCFSEFMRRVYDKKEVGLSCFFDLKKNSILLIMTFELKTWSGSVSRCFPRSSERLCN